MRPPLRTAIFVGLVLPAVSWAGQEGSLQQARIFFDEFEFTKCVQVADAAPADPTRAHERGELELVAGLCEASLGHLDEAQARFRVALRLAQDLTLPPKMGPKITARFLAAKKQAEELGALTPAVQPRPEAVPDPVVAPINLPAPAAPKRQTRIVSVALGVGAVVAVGAGVYLGARASTLSASATAAEFDSDNARFAQQARDLAVAANVVYVGAAVAAAGSVVSFVFDLP